MGIDNMSSGSRSNVSDVICQESLEVREGFGTMDTEDTFVNQLGGKETCRNFHVYLCLTADVILAPPPSFRMHWQVLDFRT